MDSVATVRELMLRNRIKTILVTATPEIIMSAYGKNNFNVIKELNTLNTEVKLKKEERNIVVVRKLLNQTHLLTCLERNLKNNSY